MITWQTDDVIKRWSGWEKETRADYLIAEYTERLKGAGFNIESNDYDIRFIQTCGFICLITLDTGYFALYTFPTEEKTYIELVSTEEKRFKAFVLCLASKELV